MPFNQSQFETTFDQLRQINHGFASASLLQSLKLHCFTELDSTNRKLWELLAQGAPEGTIVLAETQTAGKGQWGRSWDSQTGGLYLSIALAPNLPVEDAAQLTLCSTWGIATALREFPVLLATDAKKVAGPDALQVSEQVSKQVPLDSPVQVPVQVKWLNDLVLQGRKLGGILTETRLREGKIRQAVVGVGINWCNSPPPPGICLQDVLHTNPVTGLESLESLAAIVIMGLLGGYAAWQAHGVTAMLPRYLNLLVNLGQTVTWESHQGIVVGVTAQGNLHVRLQSKAEMPLMEVQMELPQAVNANSSQAPETSQDRYLSPGMVQLGYSGQR
ncbi:biotin--[acetyl-CoA-carboxylase] ligase [Alkalinema pantanalense CENA528]|uniref:biotin--[acetyl-CoA-carboxylase] ligase n=1 Tax=Alkalinema pantanalense TaxID=1620705 RepID=UPI003D6FCCC0